MLIKKVELVIKGNTFFVDGEKFQKIGKKFFEILETNDDENFKMVKLASLWYSVDKVIARTYFNKVDNSKLNILQDLCYWTVKNYINE